jgi:hypothetical protein
MTNGLANERRGERAAIREAYHQDAGRSGGACYPGQVIRDATARLAELVERGEADLASIAAVRVDGDALAHEVGGELALRWRMCVLRAVIADPPDGDAVRELYGELVDLYRDEPALLARLRPLGEEIHRLEREGVLPSALVVRSARRKRP